MAYLSESPEWEDGIYQLEIDDPVQGGADGIDNLQAKQLANRTAFLKDELEKKICSKPAAIVIGFTDDCDVKLAVDAAGVQEQINTAIAGLPEGGGKVVLREGIYNTNSAIHINKDNVVLEGTGWNTVINCAENFQSFAGVYAVDISCVVRNLHITSENNSSVENGVELQPSATGLVEGCKISISSSSENSCGILLSTNANAFNNLCINTGYKFIVVGISGGRFVQNNCCKNEGLGTETNSIGIRYAEIVINNECRNIAIAGMCIGIIGRNVQGNIVAPEVAPVTRIGIFGGIEAFGNGHDATLILNNNISLGYYNRSPLSGVSFGISVSYAGNILIANNTISGTNLRADFVWGITSPLTYTGTTTSVCLISNNKMLFWFSDYAANKICCGIHAEKSLFYWTIENNHIEIRDVRTARNKGCSLFLTQIYHSLIRNNTFKGLLGMTSDGITISPLLGTVDSLVPFGDNSDSYIGFNFEIPE